MIAMALVCGPKLLIADEPTTALDVTIQAQIIELLQALQRDLGLSILLITHDLGIVAEMCRTMVVMYAGRIVESGPSAEVFASPVIPTRPVCSTHRRAVPERGERLPTIPGTCAATGATRHRLQFRRSLPARASRNAASRLRRWPPISGRLAACWNPVP